MDIPWQAIVLARLIVANGVHSYITKRMSGDKELRVQRFLLTFIFCLAISISVIAFLGGIALSLVFFQVAAIGLLNALATYFQWKAYAINLARASLFMIFDDLIAMGLSYRFLGEGEFLTPVIWAGIVFSVMSVCFLWWSDFGVQRIKKERIERSQVLPLYLYAFLFSLVWGCAVFLMNYWATSGLPAQDFLFGWYSGSLLGAIIVASVICFFRRGNSSPKPRFRLNAKDIPWLLALAAVTFFALTLSYWALERTLLLLVQPVFLVGDMFIPAAIGFFLFKERKTFSRRQLWSLSLGIIGVILIVVATI